MTVLSVSNLSKSFGKIQALNNVTFSVPEGVTFGILGPNGSGKTTLLATITDIIKADSGSFTLFEGVPDGEARRKIGTLLETPNFYHYLNAEENLRINASIKRNGHHQIEEVLKKVNLHKRMSSKFSTFSLGMKQRLAIAASLLGDPQVLIFDEPTNGLDPAGIAEIRQLMRNLNKEGKTIIMASHLLDEVEKVCTHVAILKNGNLLTSGEVATILSNEEIVDVAAADNDRLLTILDGYSGITRIEKDEGFVRIFFLTGTADPEKLNAYCFEKGVTLIHLATKHKSLESRFFELTNN